MCYFRKGTLWHENGAGLHVKAHPAPAVWPCWLCAAPCNHSDPTQLLWYLDVISLQYTVCGVTCEEHGEGTHQMFKAVVIKNLSVWLRRTKPGEGTRPSLCLWSVLGCLKERQLWEMLCMLLRDSARTTSALSWVLLDMSLFQLTCFWSGMRQAEAIRISSLCVSQTSKYHLGGFPFALWSLAVWREAELRQQQRHWQELSWAFFPACVFKGL